MILTFLFYCICLPLAYILFTGIISLCLHYKNNQAQTIRHTKQTTNISVIHLHFALKAADTDEHASMFKSLPCDQ